MLPPSTGLRYHRDAREGKRGPDPPIGIQITTMKRVLPWLAITIAAFFFLGRHFIHRSPDFPVYHNAAISLLAGRTDLYSDTFAWVPPQIYVYPPLFVLLIAPLGLLSLQNAFGVWVGAMCVAVAAVVRRATREWKVHSEWRRALLCLLLAGPYVVLALKSGNVHLFLVLLVVWSVLNEQGAAVDRKFRTGIGWRSEDHAALPDSSIHRPAGLGHVGEGNLHYGSLVALRQPCCSELARPSR